MASKQDVFMDPDAITRIARRLETSAAVLKIIDNVLDMQIQILKTTAFIGLVGGSALERYIESIQPQIKFLANYCNEMSRDLKVAVQSFEHADHEGSSRFY